MVTDTQIREANPWWKTGNGIKEDAKIVQWQGSTIRYDPRLRHQIRYDFEPDNTVIYTVRGPRQVGKTTMIKLQIMDFLTRRHVNPWNVLYYSFDLSGSKSELVEVIESYLRLGRNYRKGPSRTYIFLDEITSVGDWQKGIKWLVDSGKVENCTILATGSQAAGILRGAERLPGRRGRTTDPYDRVLAPMKFCEFVMIRDAEVRGFVQEHRLLAPGRQRDGFLQLSAGDIPEGADLLHGRFVDRLNEHLHEYLMVGGTPKIVDEKIRTNFVSSDLYLSYLNGIRGDWGPSRNDVLLKQLTGAIIRSMGSGTSWNSLRLGAELNGGDAARDYTWLLNDLSLVYVIHRYGEKRKAPRISKEKKLYFRDPFYLHVFNWWHNTRDPFEASEEFLASQANTGGVVEGAVADHLARLSFDLAANKQGFDYTNQVFHWKDGNGREVDFVMYQEKGFEVPVEVKYRNRVAHRELGGMTHFLDKSGARRGIVLTRDELDVRTDYAMVPVPVFLMLA